jgi:hypothetical protein
VGYTKIFATGNSITACRRWNDKETVNTTRANFKVHFAPVHHQHKQMQGGQPPSMATMQQMQMWVKQKIK